MNHQGLIDQIERDYNPDNDIGSPQVTWTDANLLELIKDLYERLEKLEAQLAEAGGDNPIPPVESLRWDDKIPY